jgi:integrase/recombinase XerC/integrase/recombinase XerD
MLISQAVEHFIVEQQIRGNSERTVRGYSSILRLFTQWLENKHITAMDEISIQCVHEYQLYIDKKPSERGRNVKRTKRSVQTYIRHIRAFLTYCHAEELLAEPLHKKIRLPKAERPVIEILTDEEINRMLACFGRSETGLRNTAIIMLMLDCGLRLSEVTHLKSEDINIQKGYITVMGKGSKGRIVPIGFKVRRSILSYINKRRKSDIPTDDLLLFLSRGRKPMTVSCIAILMRKLKNEAEIPRLHAHLLRHTFATNFLVHALGDVYELSRILGHSDIRITEGYIQLASYYTILQNRNRKTYLDMK